MKKKNTVPFLNPTGPQFNQANPKPLMSKVGRWCLRLGWECSPPPPQEKKNTSSKSRMRQQLALCIK